MVLLQLPYITTNKSYVLFNYNNVRASAQISTNKASLMYNNYYNPYCCSTIYFSLTKHMCCSITIINVLQLTDSLSDACECCCSVGRAGKVGPHIISLTGVPGNIGIYCVWTISNYWTNLNYYPQHNRWPNGCSFFSQKTTTVRVNHCACDSNFNKPNLLSLAHILAQIRHLSSLAAGYVVATVWNGIESSICWSLSF